MKISRTYPVLVVILIGYIFLRYKSVPEKNYGNDMTQLKYIVTKCKVKVSHQKCQKLFQIGGAQQQLYSPNGSSMGPEERGPPKKWMQQASHAAKKISKKITKKITIPISSTSSGSELVSPSPVQLAILGAGSSSLFTYGDSSQAQPAQPPAQPAMPDAGSSSLDPSSGSARDSDAPDLEEYAVYGRAQWHLFKIKMDAEAAIHGQEQTEAVVLRHPRTPQPAQPAMPDDGSSSLDFYNNFSSQDTTIELSPAQSAIHDAGYSSSSDSVASEVDEIALFAREAKAAIHVQEQTEAAVLRYPRTAQPAQHAMHGAGSSSLFSYDNSSQDTTTEYGPLPAQPAQHAMYSAGSSSLFSYDNSSQDTTTEYGPLPAQPAQHAMQGAGSSSLFSYDDSSQDTTTEYGLSPAQPAQPAQPAMPDAGSSSLDSYDDSSHTKP